MAMTTQDKAAEIVARIPELDAKRGTFTGPTWEDAAQVFDAVLALGRDGVVAVVGMVQDVDDGNDYRVRYVLHGLAQYVGRPGKEAARATFVEALASQLGGDRPKGAQGFVARQLHVVGGKECAPALGKLLGDPDLHEFAAQALLAIRAGAVEEFRKALPGLKGAQRLTALQALGALADAESAEAFRKAAGDEDRDVRLAALWGLARIADAGAVDLALKRADVEPGWERIKATSAVLLLAERLLAGGKKSEAATIYKHLRDSRTDASEAYVREAAQDGLARAGA
jgi:HEAT repeat protein